MKAKSHSPALALATLVLVAANVPAAPAPEVAEPLVGSGLTEVLPALAGWIAEERDNICGLSDPKKLSYPAKVNFKQLMDATPEIKKLKDEGIDPDSPRGIQLRQDATDRVRRACEKVRSAESHCSVWKAIRHEDGRTVRDITSLAKAEI